MYNQKTKKKNVSTRREFLGKARTGLLAGYTFNPSMGLAQSIKTPNTERYQSVKINTHEWYGDIEERLDFPKDWNVKMYHIAGYKSPVLSKEVIRNRIQTQPIQNHCVKLPEGKNTIPAQALQSIPVLVISTDL